MVLKITNLRIFWGRCNWVFNHSLIIPNSSSSSSGVILFILKTTGFAETDTISTNSPFVKSKFVLILYKGVHKLSKILLWFWQLTFERRSVFAEYLVYCAANTRLSQHSTKTRVGTIVSFAFWSCMGVSRNLSLVWCCFCCWIHFTCFVLSNDFIFFPFFKPY